MYKRQDATRCRHCRTTLAYDIHTVGHLGKWRCENCGWQRPNLHYEANQIRREEPIQLSTPDGTLEFTTSLPGLHNSYNTIAAATAAHALGFSDKAIAKSVSETDPVFGRWETLIIGDKKIVILLAKNPTGANENIRTINDAIASSETLSSAASSHLPTLLIILNDRVADGHDVSWIWDVDYEDLLSSSSHIICSGDRAYELGLRFRYSNIQGSDIDTREPDTATTFPTIEVIPSLVASLDRAIETPSGTIFALPTYTATLELRSELTSRGIASPFWETN